MEKTTGFTTDCAHAGQVADQYGAVVTPIYNSVTYEFETTDDAAAVFSRQKAGYAYARANNPTTATVERKMAALEHGVGAVAFGSGMGVISGVLFTLLQAGDHIVCPLSFYSGTFTDVHTVLTRFGISNTPVDITDLAAVDAAFQPNTKVLYVETPANPAMIVTDLEAVCEIAHKHGALVVCDNTFCSPAVSTPLDFGVDVVVESCTKYVNGHGDSLGGMAVSKNADLLAQIRSFGLSNLGSTMAAATASLVERGLKTLSLRVERQSQNALALAEYLSKQDWVEIVRYPYLPTDPYFELAKKQMKMGGGVLTFDVKGGVEGGRQLLNHLKLMKIAVSLGEPVTLIEHAASMTHSSVPREDRLKGGITDGLIRLAVGIEDIEDLIADFEQASKYVEY